MKSLCRQLKQFKASVKYNEENYFRILFLICNILIFFHLCAAFFIRVSCAPHSLSHIMCAAHSFPYPVCRTLLPTSCAPHSPSRILCAALSFPHHVRRTFLPASCAPHIPSRILCAAHSFPHPVRRTLLPECQVVLVIKLPQLLVYQRTFIRLTAAFAVLLSTGSLCVS